MRRINSGGGGGGGDVTGLTAGAGIDLTNAGGPIVTVATDPSLLVDGQPYVVADAAASTATGERAFWTNRTGVTATMTSADLSNMTTLAGNDTNNFTITIVRHNAAGTQATIVAYTNNVASGGVTARILKNLGALANTTLLDGESVAIAITKGGSGQALLGAITIKYTIPG